MIHGWPRFSYENLAMTMLRESSSRETKSRGDHYGWPRCTRHDGAILYPYYIKYFSNLKENKLKSCFDFFRVCEVDRDMV